MTHLLMNWKTIWHWVLVATDSLFIASVLTGLSMILHHVYIYGIVNHNVLWDHGTVGLICIGATALYTMARIVFQVNTDICRHYNRNERD